MTHGSMAPAATRAGALALALMLAGCSWAGDTAAEEEKAKGVDPVAAAANAPEIDPGQYEARVEVTEFDIPGLPEAAKSEMRNQMGEAMQVTNRYCMTAEEARNGRQEMARRMANPQGDCRFERFEFEGSELDGRMVCTGMPGGGTMTMTMAGTMARDSSSMRIRSVTTNPAAPTANVTIAMNVTTRRLGDCPAGEAAASGEGAPTTTP